MSILCTNEYMPPIHPGEILGEEFMIPLRLTSEKSAAALHVLPLRITSLSEERQEVSGDLALRLSRYFATTAEFWMNMQKGYELGFARDKAGKSILQDVIPAPRDEQTGFLLTQPEEVSQQPTHA